MQKTRLVSKAPQSGQILIEYVLLLLIGLMVAKLMIKSLVGQNPEEPGILIKRWNEVWVEIGNDYPDKDQ